jgi:hypothetical protein
MTNGRIFWIAWCICWAFAWFVFGFFFFPLWLGVPCSLLSILIPVGGHKTTIVVQQQVLAPPNATWDGERWISADGLSWWDGQRWVLR